MPYATNPWDRARVYYEVEGEGLPVLLYGGLTMTLGSWHEAGYVEALSDAYRLVLLEPRGHGRSDGGGYEPARYTLERMAGDAVAVLDALGIERAYYLGYSMGASIGYVAAHAYPERFCALALGGGPLHPPLRIFNALRPVLEAGSDALVATLDRPPGSLSPERREEVLRMDARALLALIEAHSVPSPVGEVLEEIAQPALLFAGERDAIYLEVHEAARRLPNARFVSVPDADHAGAFARAGVVLPALTAFFADYPLDGQ